MFRNLLTLTYRRSGKEAFGFYLAYFLLIVLTAGLAGGIVGVVAGGQQPIAGSFALGQRVGGMIAVVGVLAISFCLLRAKQLLQHFGFVLLTIAAGILALFGGALLGLIPVAYLTTRGFTTTGSMQAA